MTLRIGGLLLCILLLACAAKNLPVSNEVSPDSGTGTDRTAEDPADSTRPAPGVWLKADGRSDTYRLIDSVLGGTGSVVETPDCADPAFGPHIRQELDTDLQEYVFSFYIHVHPDNDRCINFDRQRVEIKTYDKSPEALKAFKGDTMHLQWKFKLDKDFRPSPDFTHLHQIKAADGDAANPIITLTARYHAKGDQLEVIHVDAKGNRAVLTTAPLKGRWVEAAESTVYGTQGRYQLVIKDVKDHQVLLSYQSDDLDMWRSATTFCRPKWGIYRSLKHPEDLRDEKILFADFWMGKGKSSP